MRRIPATVERRRRYSATDQPGSDRQSATQPTVVGVEGSVAPVAAVPAGGPGAKGAAPRIVVGVDGSPASVEALRWAARQADLTGAAVEAVTSWDYPGLGHPAEGLVAAARGADLLVVGSRGHAALPGRLLGSVSEHVAARAPCPVVVVRHAPDPIALGQRTHFSGREVLSGAGSR